MASSVPGNYAQQPLSPGGQWSGPTAAILVGLAAQFLTGSLALSIFFGRIYFLVYHQALGIPQSANSVELLEYAIISPDVTIASIGIVVGSSFLLYEAIFGTVKIKNRREKRVVLGAGIVLLTIALGASIFLTDTLSRHPTLGVPGLVVAVNLFM